MHDAVWGEGTRADGVFDFGHAEENDRADAESLKLGRFRTQRSERVLDHARQRRDRLGGVYALSHEERGDQVGRCQSGFSHEPA